MFHLRRFLPLLGLLLAASLAMHAEDPWTELRSSHFRLVTNGSPAEARKVLYEAEEMRTVLRWRFPGFQIDTNAPITIYAARDLGTAFRLAPAWNTTVNYAIRDSRSSGELVQAAYMPNWERNLALVQLDTWSKVSHDRLYSGYTHEMLVQNSITRPPWFDSGISQMLSFTRFNGKDVVLGAPSRVWPALKSRPLLPVAEVIKAVTEDDWSREEPDRLTLLQNEAWGLVHFLTFAPGMKSGALLLDYFHRVQTDDRALASAAFQQVFGDPAKLDAPFAAYLHAPSIGAIIAPDLPLPDPASFSEKKLSEAESITEIGIFYAMTYEPGLARRSFEQAIRMDATVPAAHEQLGVLDYRDGKLPEARNQWQTALTLNSKSQIAAFATVMTGTAYRDQTEAQRKTTLRQLREIIHNNPRFAPAFTQVAILDWWLGDMDGASRAAAEAERLEPGRYGYKVLAARILLAQHQPRRASEVARVIATNESADGKLVGMQLWQSIPPTERQGDPPRLDGIPANLTAANGTVAHLLCGTYTPVTGFHWPPKVTMQVNGTAHTQTLQLTAADHAHFEVEDTAWIGGGRVSVCRTSQNRPVTAIYRPGNKGFGELYRLILLDDVPPGELSPAAAAFTKPAP